MQLYGREKVFAFVAAGLDRSGEPRTPPAMLLVGPCGAGKTVLLKQIEQRHRTGAPTARLDLAGDVDATPLTVMLGIKKGLSRRVPGVGVIPFPLLQLGVCALSLDPHSALDPADQLTRRLSGSEQPGQQLLAAAANAAEVLAPERKAVVTEAAALAGWLCSGMGKRQLNKHLNWYREAVDQDDGTPFGPLVHLHEQWQQACAADGAGDAGLGVAGAVARRSVWQALCAALLADLRADFNDFRWRHGQRTTNCLLLLDNADIPAGQDFLAALAQSRRDLPGQADPLVLAAAQCTRPGPDLVVGPFRLVTDDGVRYDGWPEARRLRGEPPEWCPLLLTELSAGQIQEMVKGTVLGRPWRDAHFVHGLTGGHPGVARLLATRLGAAAPGFDARCVLGPGPGPDELGAGPDGLAADPAPPAADHDLTKLMVPSWVTDPDLDAMAVCAATPGARGSACTSVFGYLGWDSADVPRIRNMLLSLRWAEGQPGGDLLVGPLPRLLLTRRLARAKAQWQDVHWAFSSHYDGITDQSAALYHRLALTTLAQPGGLHEVAEYLDQRLADQVAPADWNDLLTAITAAPNRLVPAGGQHAAVKQLAGNREPGDRLRAVTRLVAARWLFGDRLFDPAHSLASLVADEYQELDALAEGDTETFFRAAEQFRRIEHTWGDGR